eukprot:g27769.t1
MGQEQASGAHLVWDYVQHGLVGLKGLFPFYNSTTKSLAALDSHKASAPLPFSNWIEYKSALGNKSLAPWYRHQTQRSRGPSLMVLGIGELPHWTLAEFEFSKRNRECDSTQSSVLTVDVC